MIDAMKAQRLIAVCIPSIDGKVCHETMLALREEEQLLAMLPGAPWRIEPVIVAGCSAIHIARNEAAYQALHVRSADAIMWVDGDIAWEPGAIAQMMARGESFIGAAVRKKRSEVAWNIAEPEARDARGLVRVATVGTGFLFTLREVYERLAPTVGRYGGKDGEERACYFSAPGWWGEDTQFCNLWRKAGGRIVIDPSIRTTHIIAPEWSVSGRYADEEKAA